MSRPAAQERPGAQARPGSTGEVVCAFLRLGFLAFGGPAAHIAMMEEEFVERRRWVSRQRFLDLLAITQLIPGPNSTEMAIHLGYVRAGWPGLIAAGVCFIAPAALIVLALAWLYVRYEYTPGATWLMYGVKPVIIAIVLQALVRLGQAALRSLLAWALAAAVFALYLLGGHEIALLLGGALAFTLLRRGLRRRKAEAVLGLAPPLGAAAPPTAPAGAADPAPAAAAAGATMAAGAAVAAGAAAAPVPFSLGLLFLTFLKIGAVLYGSGYVLLAFLRNDFVNRLGWLTDRQLLDVVAVGQFTPGPVFTTATFVGYLTGGWWGALLATLGIFLPSFVFVGLVHPLADALRRSPWTAPLLDGVNVAAIALMAAVLVQLARSALVDAVTWGLAAASAAVLFCFRLNSAWLVLAGAAAGLLRGWVGG